MERRAAFVLLGMLYLAGTLESVQADVKIRVLTQKEIPLSLECANRSSGEKVAWYKEKIPILTALVGKEELIKIDNETGILEVLKADDIAVYGNYSCKVGNVSTDYRIVPKPSVVLPESISVVEGEKLLLVCNGKHSPGVKIVWTFGNQNYTTSKGRVKISRDQERGINGAVLTVENIEMNDRGNVCCRVSYNWSDTTEGHSAEAVSLLRVKDKLAALWPFLGICGEVVVLCAIILVYEKKRNKAELDESDTEQSPDTPEGTKPEKDAISQQVSLPDSTTTSVDTAEIKPEPKLKPE